MKWLTVVLVLSATGCAVVSGREASCADGRLNGRETEVDCGGPDCAPCLVGALCLVDTDCDSEVCTGNRCAAPSCVDQTENGEETGVDCGGPCRSCDVPLECGGDGECDGGVCRAGRCVVPSCSNGLRDGLESDVDCGGGACAGCAPLERCVRTSDCAVGVCANGRCGSAPGGCAPPLLRCGNQCVDPLVDPAHCGDCAIACGPGTRCVAGQCTGLCAGGTTRCGGACVDTFSNPLHCGGCNQPCAMGEACLGGTCLAPPCAPAQTRCGGACVSIDRDPLHCNGCGQACPMGASCIAGQCVNGCASPLQSCNAGALCVDPRNDPQHCGGCNQACALPQAAPVCVAMQCRIGACQPGFEDCNGLGADGCEANLLTSAQHCGLCGQACAMGDTCQMGACCGAPPPGPYQAQCSMCTACNGFLQCLCNDDMMVPRPAMFPLAPCGPGIFSCNGVLQCGSC